MFVFFLSDSRIVSRSLVRQTLYRMKSEIILKIKEEVEKQLKAGFLTAIAYFDWVKHTTISQML